MESFFIYYTRANSIKFKIVTRGNAHFVWRFRFCTLHLKFFFSISQINHPDDFSLCSIGVKGHEFYLFSWKKLLSSLSAFPFILYIILTSLKCSVLIVSQIPLPIPNPTVMAYILSLKREVPHNKKIIKKIIEFIIY